MSIPEISVLISIFRGAPFTKRCIASVIHQTFNDFELILTDDRGGDGAFEIAREMVEDSPLSGKTKYIINEENIGIAMSRQNSISHSRGKYLIFLDSDDFFEPDLLQEMYDSAVKYGSSLVICDFIRELPGDRHIIANDTLSGNPVSDVALKNEYVKSILSSKVGCSLWNKLIKKDLMTGYGIRFNQNMRDDFSVSPKLVWNADVISFVQKPLVHFVQTNQASCTYSFHHLRMISLTLPHLQAYFKDRGADFTREFLRYKSVTKRKMLLYRQEEISLKQLCFIYPELATSVNPAYSEPKMHYRFLLRLADSKCYGLLRAYRAVLRLFCIIYRP